MSEITAIKQYWDERAKEQGNNPQATTNDVYLREIEINYISGFLSGIADSKKVLDIGCGNGYSMFRYKANVPQHRYTGGDYSEEMIRFAEQARESNKLEIEFKVMDVLRLSQYGESYDVILTDRCLINLANEENRRKALAEIHASLHAGGSYLMIENFIEGQQELNKLRKSYGLGEIAVRWHNSFFSKEEFEKDIAGLFKLERMENISSQYYLVTRVVYSTLCAMEGREPDYDNNIYKIAAALPFCGNYGPICACLLRKL